MEYLISLMLGGAGALIMQRYAFALGFVDLPNDRSSHRIPTPRSGGVGILFAVVFSGVWLGQTLWLYLPAAFLAAVSLFDDRFGLSAKNRFLVQFACALAVVAGLRGGPGADFPSYLPLFVFWVLCLTGTANFYNFMDGINGIAGITGVLAFGGLALFGYLRGMEEAEVLFNLSVSAACLGFLPFNFPRARVFMGDVGSVLLGFLFGAQLYRYSDSPATFFLLCGLLFLFYADTYSTLFIRKMDGERLSQAHRRHLYQIMANELGLPHYAVTLLYGGVQAIVSASLLFSGPPSNIEVASLLGFWSTLFLAATYRLRKKAAAPGRVRVGK
ncbi:glycosyltransferase family 4 protein [bacterium]|nr:MAG: glycosyltransferase family 4 protein [bacterium]